MSEVVKIMVGDLENTAAPAKQFRGREAKALADLIERGGQGLSSIEHIGPRLSHYILKLRRAGLDIATVDETHAGPFHGSHGRYYLRSRVEVLAEVRA